LKIIRDRVVIIIIGKTKNIEGYQVEILKVGGPILIPHIHNLFNLDASNSRTILISPILAKLYISILEKKNSIWLESHGERDKGQAV
jgi:hypothetical protein